MLYSSPSDLPPPPPAGVPSRAALLGSPSGRGVPEPSFSSPRPLRRRSRSFSFLCRLLFFPSEPSSSSSACLDEHSQCQLA